MSAITTRETITIYESTLGPVTILARYKESVFISARVSITKDGCAIGGLSFSDDTELMTFLNCVHEFHQEIESGK